MRRIALLCLLLPALTAVLITLAPRPGASAEAALTEPGTWHFVGPTGNPVNTLAVSPSFDQDGLAFGGKWQTNFQGFEAGLGIMRSADGGQNWAGASNGLAGFTGSTAVHDYAFSPTFVADQTLYAATGGGLFKSTDQGQNWVWQSSIYSGPPGIIVAIALAPDVAASGHMLAGNGYGGHFRSTDGGATWTFHATPSAWADILYSPGYAADQTVFMAGGLPGVSRSVDGGVTWTGVLSPSVTALALSPAFTTDQTLFAGGNDFHRSTDGGQTWLTRTISADAGRVNALAVSPAFNTDQTLVAGTTGGLFWSDDAGDTWTAVAPYGGRNVNALAISPAWPADPTLLVGSGAGVFRLLSADFSTGDLRVPTTSTIPLPAGPLAVDAPTGYLVAAAHDAGVFGSGDGGQTWTALGLNEGTSFRTFTDVALSRTYAQDQTLFAAADVTFSIGGTIYRSTDGGETWDAVFSSDFFRDITLSPAFATDQTLFAIGNGGRPNVSTDGGDTWQIAAGWPPPVPDFIIARHLALPPTFPLDPTLFVATTEGLWYRGADLVWRQAATGLTNDVHVGALSVSPNYLADQTLLASARWYPPAPAGADAASSAFQYAVFRSTDGGANWSASSSGLPNVQLDALAYSPDYALDRTVYAVTYLGELYRSRDGGVNWTLVRVLPELGGRYDLLVSAAGHIIVSNGASGAWAYTSPAQDVMINGSFEVDGGWVLPDTAVRAVITTEQALNSLRSVRMGILGGPNIYSFSSARQTLTIPADATAATLTFHRYPVSGASAMAPQSDVWPDGRFAPAPTLGGDAQYGLILDAATGTVRQVLFWSLSNSQTWQAQSVDLLPYAGQPIIVHFEVLNDGAGGKTALYVDEVSLVVEEPPPTRVFLPAAARP